MLLSLILSIFFTIFSTAIMSYISMATPIGPWIETTIVLLTSLLFNICCHRISLSTKNQTIGLITAAAGIGGIIATALGFSFPTLYFMNQDLFVSWLQTPFCFCSIITSLVIAAGSLAFIIVHYCEKSLLQTEEMPFSVGQMVNKMITAQQHVQTMYQLVSGIIITALFHTTQAITSYIPNVLKITSSLHAGVFALPTLMIRLDTMPIYVAIGFVTGHVIALPLAVGVISKIMLIDPLHKLFFLTTSPENFLLAFCSGMVVQGALHSLFDLPKLLTTTYKRLHNYYYNRHTTGQGAALPIAWHLISIVGIIVIFFLTYFSFSLIGQLYLVAFTVICTYQILVIAGKIGLAPLGRFATFVAIPGLLLFGYSDIQFMLVATFVELCCGIAADCMFGRKMAQLGNISHKKIITHQLLGLIISGISAGIIFWFLINHFGLDGLPLLAIKAKNRALLIKAYHFDGQLVVLGALYGWLIGKININPVLVLGSLLMPLDASLLLIAGGLPTYLVKEKEAWYPFWSGVFATSSLWMILKAFF